MTRKPDFSNIEKVLEGKIPDRPTLFEFFLNPVLYEKLSGIKDEQSLSEISIKLVKAFQRAGYDYVTCSGSGIAFPKGDRNREQSHSLNDGALITGRESFEKYKWPEVSDFDYSSLDDVSKELPDGMKVMMKCPGGVLENLISLCGYDNLCFMLCDDPPLVGEITDKIGAILLEHVKTGLQFDCVGIIMSNDDWGFKTQTMLSPDDMRKYIIPWHRKIVQAAHEAGRKAVLHSCGNLISVMDDIIDVCAFDGKHSYEDAICPVENMYDQYHDRIAILGGIDLDFICRSTPEEVHKRSLQLVEKGMESGAYALGSGNSIPDYLPDENYFAMISAATGLNYSEFC